MQEKANIQTSTLRVPKNILEEIKIYCRKAGKPVGEWVETAWKFIEKNDFDIYDKETTPFLPVPPDIEKERNQVEALCMLMSEFITAQKQIQLLAPELIAKTAEEKVRAEMINTITVVSLTIYLIRFFLSSCLDHTPSRYLNCSGCPVPV